MNDPTTRVALRLRVQDNGVASSSETCPSPLSPVVEREQRLWESGPLVGFGVLATIAFALGALLLNGLRGSVSGASAGINALATLEALLAQLLFVGGVVLMVHLEIGLLRSRAHGALKAASVPITATFCTLLMNAAVGELAMLPLLLVSVLAALLAMGAGVTTLLRPSVPSTSIGTFLLAAGFTSALWAAARLAAYQATTLEAPPFHGASPWLASAAWAASGAFTVVALRSLVRSSPEGSRRAGFVPLALFVLAALYVSWVATRQPSFDDSTWEVFLTRALRGLLRGPAPAVPTFLVALEHLLALGAALWAFSLRSAPRSYRIVLGYCLLALRAPDTPLLALTLMLAALHGATRQTVAPQATRR